MNIHIVQNSNIDEFQIVRAALSGSGADFGIKRDEWSIGILPSLPKDGQGMELEPTTFSEPDMVLVMKGFGGEFGEESIGEIKRNFPVTPILAILGSWCEGEARTGVPLNGVHNVMWYDFLSMAPLEFHAVAHGFPTVWALPEGAWPDAMETLAQRRDRVLLPELKRKSCKMWVESDDFEQFRLLRDVFRTCFDVEVFGHFGGCEVADLGASDFLVYDFPDFNSATKSRFLELQSRFRGACVVAFVEFPRAHEWRWLQECGVARIFPKPFRIQDLRYFLS